jgi:hypothetical protein
MRTPDADLFPGALDRSYGQLLTAYVTGQQFEIEGKALRKEGVMEALGAADTDKPWTAFTSVMGGIAAAPEVQIDTPLYATAVRIPFNSRQERTRFDVANRLVLGGTHGYFAPRPNEEPGNVLRIEQYGHGHLSALARVGTITWEQQFGKILGSQNSQLVRNTKIGQLAERGLLERLPDDIQGFVQEQRDRHGEIADEFVLSSGSLSLVGMAMRRKLREAYGEDVPLAVQLPHSHKPTVERRVKYREAATMYTDQDHAPMSEAGVRSALAHQGQEQLDELTVAWQHRDIPKILKFMWELGTGFGASEGATAALRATATVVAANSFALKQRHADKRAKQRLGLN